MGGREGKEGHSYTHVNRETHATHAMITCNDAMAKHSTVPGSRLVLRGAYQPVCIAVTLPACLPVLCACSLLACSAPNKRHTHTWLKMSGLLPCALSSLSSPSSATSLPLAIKQVGGSMYWPSSPW